MLTNEIIGHKITELRIKNNLSQEALADKLGISRSSLCRYEKGSRTIDIYILNRILTTFNVSYEEFIGEALKSNFNKDKELVRIKIISYSFLSGCLLSFAVLIFEIIYSIYNPIYVKEYQSLEVLWWYISWKTPELIIFKVFFILFFIAFFVFLGLLIRTVVYEKKNIK